MTIREYFDTIFATEDFEDAADYEMTIYRCYEEDFDDFTMWAVEQGIDLTATTEIMGEAVPVLTAWAWDMCGD